MFIAGIMGMLGVLACGIGLLFTMAIVYLPVFIIYKKVIGLEDNHTTEHIDMHEDSDS